MNISRTVASTSEYAAHHATQAAVVGEFGQERLRNASLHISGVGRVGHQVAMHAAGAGVGNLSAGDSQRIESENFGPYVFARRPDLGEWKVYALERFFHGRPDFVFEPIVAPTESPEVDAYIARADLVISCANTVSARLAAEEKAIRLGKPVMQVAAFDHREAIGGLITLRQPKIPGACFGCLIGDDPEFPRGEGLLSTATAALAAIAANMAVQLLTGVRAEFLTRHNVFFIDLERYAIEPMAVLPRPGCKLCGAKDSEE